MRIGSGNNFLSIEKLGSEGLHSVCRLEAEMSDDHWRFAFLDCTVRVDVSGDIREDLAEFEAFKTQRLHIMLSEGGWLRIKRGPRGHVLVGYHVARLRSGAAVHGEVVAEPDTAPAMCRELAAIL